ncbi:MAG TPA: hypothetical protein VFV75_12995 [Candidatus Polarisedimenticolaceae bacterium]|nr:hypothetical protein [Candidatus Polarisedimenticolaceae bacterium]
MKLDRILAPTCSERTAVEVEEPRWVVDRCGTPVAWDVRRTPTSLAASLAGETPPAPHAPTVPSTVPDLPARTFVVTSLGDSGPGSLTRALLDANATANGPAPDRIRFALPDGGPRAIELLAPLPPITEAVVLDGEGIELDGSRLRDAAPALLVLAGGSTVRGLRLRGFAGEGIRLEGAGGSTLEGNTIEGGTIGIAVVDSPDNRIAGNALTGTSGPAVRVRGVASTGNRILGNRIVRIGKQGIDLQADRPSALEVPGPGPNLFQPAPALDTVAFDRVDEGKKVEARIEGTLTAAPGATYHVELFATDFEQAKEGALSGDRLLASAEVATGEDGFAGFVFRLPEGMRSKDRITATATDAGGNTSEFSNGVDAPSLAIAWNTGTGNWSTAGNWSPAQLPAAGDTVTIAANGANTTFTVTLDVDSTISGLTVGGGSGVQTLSIVNGLRILTLNGASTVNAGGALAHSAGTIGGTGTLTINGGYDWTGGVQTGAGTTTVNGTFHCAGVVGINGGRTLNNATTLAWNPATGSGFRTGTGSIINNSGTWDSQSDGVIVNFYGGTSTFNNTGLFKKSAGTTTTITIPFTHTAGTIEAAAGTITFNAGGTSAAAWNASAAGGTLQYGGGTWELNTGTTWAGPGKISIFTGGNVNVNAALTLPAATTLDFSAGLLGGTATLTLNGPFLWSGGRMTGAGTTTVNGIFNVSATVEINLGRTLNNATTLTWTGGNGSGFRTGTGSIINNTGTWDAQANTVIVNFFGGTTTFNNSGTLKKSGGTGTTSIDIPVQHSGGSIQAQTGLLTMNGGGTSTAPWSASAGATLQFGGGVWDLNAGTSVAGAGTFSIFTAGTVNVNAALAVPAGTTLDFSAGTLGGTATLTVNGTLLWSGGLMTGAGTTQVNAPWTCTGVVGINGGRILNNATTASWNPATGSGVRMGGGGVINNSGTWDSQSNGVIVNFYGGAATVNNTGTFKKSAGTGTTSIGVPFNHNGGTVDTQSGLLTLNGGGTSAAPMVVSNAAATLQFGGGVWDLNGGTSFSGPGTVSIFTASTVAVNAAVSTAAATTLSFTAGTLQGTGTFTLNGPVLWNAGLMTGAGTTQINGPFNCAGVVGINGNRVVNTAGATTWNPANGSGIRMGTGAVIHNAGVWDAPTDGVIVNFYGGTATFDNTSTGTFKKSAGTGATAINVTFTNAGTVDVQSGTLQLNLSSYTQTAGITKLTGGAISSTTVLTFQGGTLGGSGTVTAPVTVTGTGSVAPGLSAGTLSLIGLYTQNGGGAYKVELGGLTPGTQHDRVNISGGAAMLAGGLQISLIDGFVPSPGDTFTVLTYPTRNGAFTVVPPAIPCLGWRVDYGATALTLTALQLPGEVTGFGAAANRDLVWDAVVAPGAVTYDVLRGNLRNFPVGTGPGEVCLAPNITAATVPDPAVPAANGGFWYVARREVAGCGLGGYGTATGGAPRISAACP